MRKKLRRKKMQLLSEGLRWWMPYLSLIEHAHQQGYRMNHKQYSRRYRWFVDYITVTHFSMNKHGINMKHMAKRVFTSGSMHSCINALKLASDWRGNDAEG